MADKGLLKAREAEWYFKMLYYSLRYHKFRYYVMDKPVLSDSEYDSLERQFSNACETLKQWPNVYEAFGKPEAWVDSTDYIGMPRTDTPWKKGQEAKHE